MNNVHLHWLMSKYEDEGETVKVPSFQDDCGSRENRIIAWSKLLAPFRESCLAYQDTHAWSRERVVASHPRLRSAATRHLNPLVSDDGRAKLTNERNWFWKTLNINRNPMWPLNF